MKRPLALLALLAVTPAGAQAFDPFHEARIDNRLGALVPIDARLSDADGSVTTLRGLGHGRPILLAPVLHHCPNLCGVTLAGLAEAVELQKGVPGRDFTIIAFGIDPREGINAARDDLGQHAGPGFHAVVAPEATIRAVTDALGYHYAWDPRIGQYAHAAGVAVLTPEGRLSGWLYGVSPTPATLQAALARAGAGTTSSWISPLLLLCYHYDPATGRYTLAITRILQLAALVTIAGIAILVLRPRRRAA